MKLKNVYSLLKFFCNDTFNGIFKRPFFKNKINRYGLISVVFFLYLAYFYLNMVYLSDLSRSTTSLTIYEHIRLGKITLSSYVNSIIVIGVFIFIFINSTIKFTKSSLFMIKTLPISNDVIKISMRIFKIGGALVLFELLMVIVAPALKLIPMNIGIACVVLLMLHIVFISIFLILEFIYKKIISNKIGLSRFIRKVVLDLGFMFSAIVYYFSEFRFAMDTWVSTLSLSVFQITFIIVLICCLILSLFCYIGSLVNDNQGIYIERVFIKVPLMRIPNLKLNMVLSALVRNINFLYLCGIAAIIIFISILSNGMNEMGQILLFVLPTILICCIAYADATLSFRRMYSIYCFKPLEEFTSIFLVSCVLALPNLFVGYMVLRNIDLYLYALCIVFASIIIGFLFPKSQSNINETVSVLLVFLMILILSLLANIRGSLFPSLLVLMLLLYFVLKKEYEVMK